MSTKPGYCEVPAAELQRLIEAEETLEAIRLGSVDAVVVDGDDGQHIYTLESPDQPFRIFVEQMQEGALTLASDGTIVYCNPFFAKLIGLAPEHVKGARLQELVTQESLTCLMAFTATAPEASFRCECSLRHSSDAEVLVQLSFSRLPSAESGMFGVVVTDLTAREQARRLEQQRQAAEEANAARDQFLAVVSHELRTPLNAIMGWAQLLGRRTDLPEAARRGLEIIERSGWAQAELIDDLLDVSRVLAGKLRLDRDPTELCAIVTAAIGSVQPQADAKQIKLQPDLPEYDIVVLGDSARLRQIICNLLNNAIKYTASGGRTKIRVFREDDRACIEIVDSGIGIAPEFLPKLFGLFEQADASASRKAGGLGLGLAIVKQLLDLHGGSITIDSQGEGTGTTATVHLPLTLATLTAQPQPHPVAPDALLLTGLRVLLVEDEVWALEMMQQTLQDAQATVITASNGPQALAALERQPVDIVVSDLGLPGMDGYQLIQHIRASGRCSSSLPAIAITAFASRDDRRRVMHAGFQRHLAKPTDQEELCAVIAELCGRAPAGF